MSQAPHSDGLYGMENKVEYHLLLLATESGQYHKTKNKYPHECTVNYDRCQYVLLLKDQL